jgi:hypothetical protein
MSGFRGIHWVSPTTMAASFALGVLLAIGHHLFYKSLAGTTASTTTFEAFGVLDVSPQQFNVAIGTAFALLSKTGFLIAVTIAYVQGFWSVVTSYRNRKRMTLVQLDNMFEVLDDITAFLHFGIWFKHPLLLFMALIAW